MRIAIPIWENKVSPVFDTASRLLILEMENQSEASRFEIFLDEQNLSRRSLRVRALGVDVLICGAISRPLSTMLVASGVHVIPGITGAAAEVLDVFLRGEPFQRRFLMPGFGGNGHRKIRGIPGKERDPLPQGFEKKE